MDLSETYRSIARRYFPNATIVADRFHVVRLINQHFLKVWQQVHPGGPQEPGPAQSDAPTSMAPE